MPFRWNPACPPHCRRGSPTRHSSFQRYTNFHGSRTMQNDWHHWFGRQDHYNHSRWTNGERCLWQSSIYRRQYRPLINYVDEMKPTDLAILEISSFQLEQMTISPNVASILNITPNHLDRHGTMELIPPPKRASLNFNLQKISLCLDGMMQARGT